MVSIGEREHIWDIVCSSAFCGADPGVIDKTVRFVGLNVSVQLTSPDQRRYRS